MKKVAIGFIANGIMWITIIAYMVMKVGLKSFLDLDLTGKATVGGAFFSAIACICFGYWLLQRKKDIGEWDGKSLITMKSSDFAKERDSKEYLTKVRSGNIFQS